MQVIFATTVERQSLKDIGSGSNLFEEKLFHYKYWFGYNPKTVVIQISLIKKFQLFQIFVFKFCMCLEQLKEYPRFNYR